MTVSAMKLETSRSQCMVQVLGTVAGCFVLTELFQFSWRSWLHPVSSILAAVVLGPLAWIAVRNSLLLLREMLVPLPRAQLTGNKLMVRRAGESSALELDVDDLLLLVVGDSNSVFDRNWTLYLPSDHELGEGEPLFSAAEGRWMRRLSLDLLGFDKQDRKLLEYLSGWLKARRGIPSGEADSCKLDGVNKDAKYLVESGSSEQFPSLEEYVRSLEEESDL